MISFRAAVSAVTLSVGLAASAAVTGAAAAAPMDVDAQQSVGYYIVSGLGNCLDTGTKLNPPENTMLRTWECNKTVAQRFRFKGTGDKNHYQIIHRSTGLCLEEIVPEKKEDPWVVALKKCGLTAEAAQDWKYNNNKTWKNAQQGRFLTDKRNGNTVVTEPKDGNTAPARHKWDNNPISG